MPPDPFLAYRHHQRLDVDHHGGTYRSAEAGAGRPVGRNLTLERPNG